jgi:glycine betaine/proline transport system ATP-binding protein
VNDRSNTTGEDARDIKLRCRALWKVFHDGKDVRLSAEDLSDAAATAARLQAKGMTPAVIDVSFDVRQGEIFVIMGLSGSGKSTLVRCLSRLVEPSAGEVIFNDRDLLRASARELMDIRRHKMGMVFQHFGLMPHLSAEENVAFPLKIQGVKPAERRQTAREMLTLVGLAGRERAFPHELSGGQQQRVGIARSLAVGPELWFLDEPFSALDPLIRRQMQDEFMRLQKLLHKTIVFITHDFLEALRVADRVAIMRDGRIVQIGRPAEIVLKPADDYVARFVADVPLARVLKAADLVTDIPAGPGARPVVRPDCTLEELLPLLAANEAIDVASGGSRLGSISRQAALAALGHRASFAAA